jgi:hypothetical protein
MRSSSGWHEPEGTGQSGSRGASAELAAATDRRPETRAARCRQMDTERQLAGGRRRRCDWCKCGVVATM